MTRIVVPRVRCVRAEWDLVSIHSNRHNSMHRSMNKSMHNNMFDSKSEWPRTNAVEDGWSAETSEWQAVEHRRG